MIYLSILIVKLNDKSNKQQIHLISKMNSPVIKKIQSFKTFCFAVQETMFIFILILNFFNI